MVDESDLDSDLKALKEETQGGNRIQDVAKEDAYREFQEAVVESLHNRSTSGTNQTVSIWDKELAALTDVLKENPELLDRVGTELENELGRPTSEDEQMTRGELLGMFVRVGMQEADPELFEMWRDAVAEWVRAP
ncbi:hypothetical protein [Natrinema soli]|jgi:hypothetical protein|uniref:DUF8115 domain-containing protein n=1 Tax=Natrinema soli TaxID=1930624 RepID=A0ABD5SI03_9EURY|nr:hypothetical protein [Natrinema soli]